MDARRNNISWAEDADSTVLSGAEVILLLTDEEIAELLAAYDASNHLSPSAAKSRELARIILDALLAV